MPKSLKVIMALGGVLFVLSLGAIIMLGSVARSARSPRIAAATAAPGPLVPEPGIAGLTLPEFSLVNQDGVPVSLADFKGRVTITDYFFTHCPFICPRLTAQMLEMAEALKGTPVRFASFSVDPERDTPARLKAYASEKAIGTARWHLLTGATGAVEAIVKGALRFEMGPDTARTITLPDGTTMHNITHPGHFVLIGPKGEVLAMRRSSEPGAVEQMAALARAAADAAGLK